MSFGWARIVSYLAPQDPFAFAYGEVFAHFAIPHERAEHFTASELNRTHVMLFCGKGQLSSYQLEILTQWVKNGGTAIFSGGTWGANSLIGLQPETVSRGSGKLKPVQADRLIPEVRIPIRFFGGETAAAAACHVLATVADGQAVLTRTHCGKGTIIFCGVHLGQTLLQMQFGRSVEVDGIGPEDGSAQLDDGKLRAEDGITLDFSTDRETVGAHAAFLTAHADILREIWMRSILQAIQASGQGSIFPWFWPGGAPAAGVLSLDCEDPDTANVANVHRMLAMYGIPATWSVSLPGYGQDVYRTIRAREHEVALLFYDEGKESAGEERLRSQMSQLVRLAGEPTLSCVRPTDGMWRGWNRFYDHCDLAGLRLSISKGGRQPGTQGFAFGSSMPFFAPQKNGHPGHVAELPYAIFKPGVVADDEVCDVVAAEVLARSGCLHIAATPACFSERQSADSMRRLLTNARQDGFSFMRAGDVYRWEQGRRSLRLNFKNIGGELNLGVVADSEMTQLTLILVQIPASVTLNGKPVPFRTEERFGMPMATVMLDLRAKHSAELKFGYEISTAYDAA